MDPMTKIQVTMISDALGRKTAEERREIFNLIGQNYCLICGKLKGLFSDDPTTCWIPSVEAHRK